MSNEDFDADATQWCAEHSASNPQTYGPANHGFGVCHIPDPLSSATGDEVRRRLIAAEPYLLEALQAIEQLSRGTLSTHIHAIAVAAINKV